RARCASPLSRACATTSPPARSCASTPERGGSGPQDRVPGTCAGRDAALPLGISERTQRCVLGASPVEREQMPRAIWTGSISFGLLNVPVKLYSAVSRRNVSFRELRRSDGSRIRHKRVAEADGEEVSYDQIVKGYEIAPEQYIVIT